MFLYLLLVLLGQSKAGLLHHENRDHMNGLYPCQKNCSTLSNCTDQGTANVCIHLNASNVPLDYVLKFTKVTNFSIIGQGVEATQLTCNQSLSAGMVFAESYNIVISNLSIHGCGAGNVANVTTLLFHDCSNVMIAGILVSNSHGEGLTLVNTAGTVFIFSSRFIHDTKSKPTGQRGLQVLHNHSNNKTTRQKSNTSQVEYTIQQCTFLNNTAYTLAKPPTSNISNQGGGILVALMSNISIKFTVIETTFLSNEAYYGGGLSIYCPNSCFGSRINISTTNFSRNRASSNGGGVSVACPAMVEPNIHPRTDVFSFSSCKFEKNQATYGGGMTIYLMQPCCTEQALEIRFSWSMWINNSAVSGAAVSVYKDYFGTNSDYLRNGIFFNNCSFLSNFAVRGYPYKHQGGAVLSTLQTDIIFSERVLFKHNNLTAIFAENGWAIFNSNTKAVFEGNVGDKGGAIFLSGDATIRFGEQTDFRFSHNQAVYGGAIYAVPVQSYYPPYTCIVCFMTWDTTSSTATNGTFNPNFYFENNTATATHPYGNDIYVTSLRPCADMCQDITKQTMHVADVFTNSCLGNFHAKDGKLGVVTNPQHMSVHPTTTITFIPGFPKIVNITQLDDFNNSVVGVFPITVKSSSSEVLVDSNYLTIANNTIMLNGNPSSKTYTLILLTSATSGLKTELTFTLSSCPPGFVITSPTIRKCTCSAIPPSITCKNGTAWIALGHWAGYNQPEPDKLLVGTCATELCNFNGTPPVDGHYLLPPNYNSSLLVTVVCGDFRNGTLCGQCNNNFSTFYHSPTYACRNATGGCPYGIPLYILSELLPVTGLFLVILLFNINLTSGALYSFVFFAQVLDSTSITAFGNVKVSHWFTNGLFSLVRVIYGLFDLSLVSSEYFSFCIIKNAGVMHVLLFKYLTVLYSLLLIVAVIVIMKLHSLYSCIVLCHKYGRRNVRGSVVNGLAAFLIICYWQCARVCSIILTSSTIANENRTVSKRVPIFAGHLKFLKGQHLYFAVPALLCFAVVILPPALVLTLEPFLTKLCRFNSGKLRAISFHLRIFHLKMKPFLDCFQGCFKGDCHVFAGLYFVYRVLIPLMYIVCSTVIECYVATETILFAILLTHGLVQPYRKRLHNAIDLTLLTNMLIINTFTILNYYNSTQGSYQSGVNVNLIFCVQLILLILPLLCIVFYLCVHIYGFFKSRFRQHTNKESVTRLSVQLRSSDGLSDFPDRLLGDNADTTSYKTF